MELYEHPKFKGYFVDIEGNVYSKRGLLKGNINARGYRRHEIQGTAIRTHRFIWEAITNTLLNKDEIINHLDLNKLNNRFSNLEKTDTAGNTQHFYTKTKDYLYRDVKCSLHHNSGELHPLSKLTIDKVKQIIHLLDSNTNKMLAKSFNVDPSTISQIRRKSRWKTVWMEIESERSETIPNGSR